MTPRAMREQQVEAELADLYIRLEKAEAAYAAYEAGDEIINGDAIEDLICELRGEIEDLEGEADIEDHRSLEAWARWATL
jgi:hypothetical protein